MVKKNGRKQLGQSGEDLAARFLIAAGYRIVERNYRAERGEIDIIAQDADELVFVEVKTDRTGKFGAPETWVTQRKQKQIAKVAELYLQKLATQPPPCRFDIITISFTLGAHQINHFKNAFSLENGYYANDTW